METGVDARRVCKRVVCMFRPLLSSPCLKRTGGVSEFSVAGALRFSDVFYYLIYVMLSSALKSIICRWPFIPLAGMFRLSFIAALSFSYFQYRLFSLGILVSSPYTETKTRVARERERIRDRHKTRVPDLRWTAALNRSVESIVNSSFEKQSW